MPQLRDFLLQAMVGGEGRLAFLGSCEVFAEGRYLDSFLL